MMPTIRLAVLALLALALAQSAVAANDYLQVATFAVTPAEAAQQSTVTFSGKVAVVCLDTSGDGGCAGSVASDPNEPLPNSVCLDTSGDGGCSEPPSAAAVACRTAGKVWVYVTSFRGRVFSDATGACATSLGAFGGTMPALSAATKTRVDTYASLTPLNAPPVADPQGTAPQTWAMASFSVMPQAVVAIQSLNCNPNILPAGAQANAMVTMTRAINTVQTIELSGSSAYASTPKTLIIPANATTASFKITAGKAPADATASLKAADKTSSQTCTIKILKSN